MTWRQPAARCQVFILPRRKPSNSGNMTALTQASLSHGIYLPHVAVQGGNSERSASVTKPNLKWSTQLSTQAFAHMSGNVARRHWKQCRKIPDEAQSCFCLLQSAYNTTSSACSWSGNPIVSHQFDRIAMARPYDSVLLQNRAEVPQHCNIAKSRSCCLDCCVKFSFGTCETHNCMCC